MWFQVLSLVEAWGWVPAGRGLGRGDDDGGKLERKGNLLVFTGSISGRDCILEAGDKTGARNRKETSKL